jgi:hypothetical protein
MSEQPSNLRLRFETVGSITAIVVGVAALWVSFDQARVMRAQQHASVLPALQIDGYWGEYEGGPRIGVRVSNNGVGPAIIHDVTLLRDGEPTTAYGDLMAIFPDEVSTSWSSMNGRIMAAGSVVEPMSIALSELPQGEAQQALVSEWVRWGLEICYCSVFDRCWVANTESLGERNAPPGGMCPTPDTDIFEEIGLADTTD